MQKPVIEKVPGSKTKLSFTVTPEEAQPYIDEAVSQLSIEKSIPGFRPGKAPYTEAAKQFGEMKIWEHALERIVRACYMHAILEGDLDTVGSPEISVEQLVPHQEIRFTAIAPIAPTIEKMADYTKPRSEFSPHKVTDEDVEKAVSDLRMMQRKEVASTEPAVDDDLVVIDLDIKKDHVALEDGVARGFRIYLGEESYIPGFTKELLGIKTGEERTFTLPFPTEHFQKHLAGKDADFSVKATGVFKLGLPELNDEFAHSLGQKDMATLKELIRHNLEMEEEGKARDKSEIEMLEKLVDESAFSEIPDLLVNEEIRKMIAELESTVTERNMKMENYLSSIKKTRDELKLEFVPQAMRRIRVATLIKEVAKRENIHVTDEELDTEIDRILAGLREDDAEARARVASPEYREYVAIIMRNRKALDVLRKNGIKGYPKQEREDEDHDCVDEHCDHDHHHQA